MGYYTSYYFSAYEKDGKTPVEEKVMHDIAEKLIEFSDDMCGAISEDGFPDEDSRWYEHEKELSDFSLKYPENVLLLGGFGETNEDMWRKYFFRGKMYPAHAIITYPEYDPEQLVEVTA